MDVAYGKVQVVKHFQVHILEIASAFLFVLLFFFLICGQLAPEFLDKLFYLEHNYLALLLPRELVSGILRQDLNGLDFDHQRSSKQILPRDCYKKTTDIGVCDAIRQSQDSKQSWFQTYVHNFHCA